MRKGSEASLCVYYWQMAGSLLGNIYEKHRHD